MAPFVRIRIAAALLCIVAAALRVWTYHLRHEFNLFLTTALALAVPFAIYALLLWPLRRTPRTFAARAGSFTTLPGPIVGLWIVGFGFMAGPLLTLGYWKAWAIFVAVLVPIQLAWRGLLRLTPAGVEIRFFRTRRVPWEAIAPHQPEDPLPNYPQIRFSALEQGKQRSHVIWLGRRLSYPTFVARAIRHYAQHPEHRAAIGTQSELDRLAALTN